MQQFQVSVSSCCFQSSTKPLLLVFVLLDKSGASLCKCGEPGSLCQPSATLLFSPQNAKPATTSPASSPHAALAASDSKPGESCWPSRAWNPTSQTMKMMSWSSRRQQQPPKHGVAEEQALGLFTPSSPETEPSILMVRKNGRTLIIPGAVSKESAFPCTAVLGKEYLLSSGLFQVMDTL